MTVVLIMGSGPNVVESRDWDRHAFDHIVAINNAWAVRPDWDYLICPDDFPTDKRPVDISVQQRVITSETYVPVQNNYGGFVYAGGTMAFTAGYWALHTFKPRVIAFIGCDMVYAASGNTHFYGKGEADPLRPDISLRSLEAKATRMRLFAAANGCALVNLSTADSRLTFPRATPDTLHAAQPQPAPDRLRAIQDAEQSLGYYVPSGKYWKEEHRFDPVEIDRIDAMWRDAS